MFKTCQFVAYYKNKIKKVSVARGDVMLNVLQSTNLKGVSDLFLTLMLALCSSHFDGHVWR